MERRLAAILAADVVGYSRLMGEDEVGTLARLKAARETVLAPLIAEHRGRVVKLMGDGMLVEFASIVDAVNCAVACQAALAERERDRGEKAPLSYRMGINLGDVIIEGDDIYGDGVNLAARLEPLAAPGGVCVSGGVYDQVRAKSKVAFRDLGPQRLKNIAQPLRVYAVETGAPAAPAPGAASSVEREERPSLAVLPFKNLSGDVDQEYFADGVSEDIITALSRHRWLMVIARNSSFVFKGTAASPREVAGQLGVRYLLDGSLRKGGERIRIAAQLIEADSGKQLWAARYDRVLEDIFALQDELTEAIVAAIAPELGKAEQRRVTAKSAEDLTAWDLYQRGMWHLYRRTEADLAEARRLFEAALSRNAGLGAAYAGLVDAYYYEVVLNLAESVQGNREKALAAARRAVELDADDAAAHCAMGKARIVRREHALAVADLQLAIELNPSLAWAHYGLGAAAVFSGQAAQAIRPLEDAIRLSPRDQHMGSFMVRLAEAHLLLENHRAAVDWARKALQQQGFQWSRYAALIAALGFLGARAEAEAALTECRAQRPDFSVTMVRDHHLYTDTAALGHYLKGLRLAGVPD